MHKVNVFEVKAKFSEYLDHAIRGERVVICRHNRPVAELRAFDELRTEPRPIGPLPGRPTFEVPASFFEPLSSEELDLWDGSLPDKATGPAKKPAARASRVAEHKSGYGTPRRGGGTRRRP